MKNNKLIILPILMGLFLSACGGGDDSSKKEEKTQEVNKDAIYREEKDIFVLGEGDVSSVVPIDNKLYIDKYIYDFSEAGISEEMVEADVVAEEEAVETEGDTADNNDGEEEASDSQESVQIMGSGGYKRVIMEVDLEGGQKELMQLQYSMNEGGGTFTVDAQGNIYTLHTIYATYEGDDTKDKIYLHAYDSKGNELWKLHLNEKTAEGEYYYTSGLFMTQSGNLLVDSQRGIEVYDTSGNPVKLIEKPSDNEANLKQIRDGKYALFYSDGQKAYAQPIDVETGQTSEKVELQFNYFRYNIQNGLYYDLYLSDDYGVYGYNIGDELPTKLMDYISSDFGGNTMNMVLFLDENTFIGNYWGDEGNVFSKFIKVPADEVVDKIELTLACYSLESRVKTQLIEFNRNSSKYKINIHDYVTYDTMDDYTQGLTRLNADIISGNVPDIMLINSKMPVNSYISKGLFADLNEFIEKDEDFNKEDYLENVFQALSTKDGMYQIAPAFVVSTFSAKTADVGTEPGWTMEEALKLLESKPEGTALLSEITRDNLLYYLSWINIDEYIDWETGECHFDSPGFIQILDFAKTLPAEIDYTAVMDDESYWNEMELQYRNGKTILHMTHLSGFRDFQYMEQGNFGEDITLIGFPSQEGIGAGMNFTTNLAISSQSKNQEAAWEFVKSFFTEEFQDKLDYEFPVRLSSLDKLEEKAWEKPYYIDENGNKEEYDDYYYLNGAEVKMTPLTKDKTKMIKDYLKQVTNVATANEDIYNIILEETAGFFNGQKSAGEVAEIIQSRVKIYVNENR